MICEIEFQCIVASLSNLVGTLNTLSHNLSDNLQRLTNLVSASFEDEEEKPDGLITTTSAESTESTVDVEKSDTILVGKLEEARVEVGNLSHEVESLNEKLKKAEQVTNLTCSQIKMSLGILSTEFVG
jgi:hypothetical protein